MQDSGFSSGQAYVYTAAKPLVSGIPEPTIDVTRVPLRMIPTVELEVPTLPRTWGMDDMKDIASLPEIKQARQLLISRKDQKMSRWGQLDEFQSWFMQEVQTWT